MTAIVPLIQSNVGVFQASCIAALTPFGVARDTRSSAGWGAQDPDPVSSRVRITTETCGMSRRGPITSDDTANQRRRTKVSISPIGGVTPHAAFQPIGRAGTPESAEAAGAADHDGDSDDHGVSAAAASQVKTGSVNQIA